MMGKKMEIRDIKEAVKNGVTFLKSVYEDAIAIRVEEVEMDDQQQYWLVTFSYGSATTEPANAEPTTWPELAFVYPSRDRNYKALKIDAKTGVVTSMKIRELQG